jgi:hypothetical protein
LGVVWEKSEFTVVIVIIVTAPERIVAAGSGVFGLETWRATDNAAFDGAV